MVALHVANAQKTRDRQHLHGQRRRTQHHGVAALLMCFDDVAHVRIHPHGNTFDEQPLTHLVEVTQRFAPQITRGPDDEVLELEAPETVAERGVEGAEHLADPGLPAPDSLTEVNGRGEAVDQRAVEIEDRTHTGSC